MVVEEAMMQSLAETRSGELHVDTLAPTPIGASAYARSTTRVRDSTDPHGVVSVPATTRTLSAYKTMKDAKLLAVALVDDDGKLVGDLAASDTKLLASTTPPELSYLRLPAIEFVTKSRGRGNNNTRPAGSISEPSYATLSRHAPLEQAVDKMVETAVARVWVVDEAWKPIGVVTASDVITMLVPDGDD
ncbi:hypothetical protein HK104_007939 [Borealophlyctis nickersoniae]|nr:hypothetical protein HK104_007939 [Borealophlyctis nickersoniae]